MTRTRLSILVAIVLLATNTACSGLMVRVGLSEGPPPVTDAEYFNGQMDTLMERLKANQSRGFRKATVLNFVNSDGRVSELGKYLTGKFGERAVANGMFRVTPPGQVVETLKNLKISFDGTLTKEQVALIGAELGVDAIIMGTVSDLQKGSDVDLNVKAVQTGTGEMLSSASINIYRSKQVQTLIQQF